MRTIQLPRDITLFRVAWIETEFVVSCLKYIGGKRHDSTLEDEDGNDTSDKEILCLTNGHTTVSYSHPYEYNYTPVKLKGDYGFYFGRKEWTDRYDGDTRAIYIPEKHSTFFTWKGGVRPFSEVKPGKVLDLWTSRDEFCTNDNVTVMTTYRSSFKWTNNTNTILLKCLAGPTEFDRIAKMKNTNTKLFVFYRGTKEVKIFELRKRIEKVILSGDGLSVACTHSNSVTILDLE